MNVFLKDARRLWLYILLYLAFLAFHLSVQLTPQYPLLDVVSIWAYFIGLFKKNADNLIDFRAFFSALLSALAYPCMWYLIAALVRKDNPAGDRQSELVPPLTWQRILLAKALFILVFILLPLFIIHIAVVKWLGFPLSGNLHELLIKMLVFTILWVLPALALAAIARKILLMTLAALIGLLVTAVIVFDPFSLNLIQPWGEFWWIRQSIVLIMLLAGSTSVLLIHYKHRKTKLARALAIAFSFAIAYVALLLPPGNWAFSVQKLFSKRSFEDSAVRITLESSERNYEKHYYGSLFHSGYWLRFPIRIENMPVGMDIHGAAVQFSTHMGESAGWHKDWYLADIVMPQWALKDLQDKGEILRDIRLLHLPINPAFYTQGEDSLSRITGSIDMTLFEQETLTIDPRNASHIYVPDIGICTISGSSFLNVDKRFSIWRHAYLDKDFLGSINPFIFSTVSSDICAPWPTSAFLSPVESTGSDYFFPGPPRRQKTLDFRIWRPVAHIRRAFEFNNVRLRDYCVYGPDR
jgi:hypothetical protein